MFITLNKYYSAQQHRLLNAKLPTLSSLGGHSKDVNQDITVVSIFILSKLVANLSNLKSSGIFNATMWCSCGCSALYLRWATCRRHYIHSWYGLVLAFHAEQ